jgi:hypothetical protein
MSGSASHPNKSIKEMKSGKVQSQEVYQHQPHEGRGQKIISAHLWVTNMNFRFK